MRIVFSAVLAAILTSTLVGLRLSDSVGGNLWWWDGEGAENHVTYSYLNIGLMAIISWSAICVILLLASFALTFSIGTFQNALKRRDK
jgi:hypothetical protein